MNDPHLLMIKDSRLNVFFPGLIAIDLCSTALQFTPLLMIYERIDKRI